MSHEDDEDGFDEELMRELDELNAISAPVSQAKPAKRNEPAVDKQQKGGGKKTIEQQLLGEPELDIDEEDLEDELNALVGSDISSAEPRQKQAKHSPVDVTSSLENPETDRSHPTPVPQRAPSQSNTSSSKQNDPPIQQQPKPMDIAPPLPPRKTSDVPQLPTSSLILPPVQEDTDVKTRAMNLLLRRKEAYLANVRLANEDGNIKYAKECADTVIMFDQALEACEEQEVTMEDLCNIPGTPPPYKKKQVVEIPKAQTLEQELVNRITKFEELATKHEEQGDSSRARMQRRLGSQIKDALKVYKRGGRIQPDQLPVPLGFAKLAPLSGEGQARPAAGPSRLSAPSQQTRSKTPSPTRSESSPEIQAEILRTKALEYKKSALTAKNNGDLPLAVKYLQAAKAVEKKADSLNPPSSTQALTVDAHTEVQIAASSKLLANLKHQLEMIMKLRTQFNAVKDTKRTLFYDELIKKCSADLKTCHHEVKSGHDPLMRYKVNELTLPTLEINPGMPADTLELKICSISNVKMPEGWKPSDAQTFVTYDFPFPHEAHQTGKSQIVYKTDSPVFNESFQLKINRKSRQLQRVCQRASIKLAVYQKGGFLRSDKFCGEADVQFGAIIDQATIHVEQDLLDRRKKTGGVILLEPYRTAEIRVQKPLDEKKMNATKKYPWIRLDAMTSL